jgi:hypothetical protein
VVAEGRLIRVGTPEDLIIDPGSPEVASLIGVEQKMRYLDLLSIRLLMVPVDPSRVIEVGFSAGDARKAMIASRAEYLLAGQGGVLEGIIFPQHRKTRLFENNCSQVPQADVSPDSR